MNDLVNLSPLHVSDGKPSNPDGARFLPAIEAVKTSSGTAVSPGGITSDTKLQLFGKGPLNQTIRILDWDTELTSVRLDASGQFQARVEDLTYRDHGFRVVTEDGQTSATYLVRVQAEVTITEVLNSKGLPVGNGGITADPELHFTGRAVPNSQIQLFDNNTLAAIVSVDNNGHWRTFLSLLKPHITMWHQYRAVATDGQKSDTWDIYVNGLEFTVIESVKDDKGNFLFNGETTYKTSLSINGRSGPGQKLELFDNGGLIKTINVDPNGLWSIRKNLTEGEHKFKAVTATGSSLFWIIHVEAKPAPVIDNVTDNEGQPISNGGSTSGETITLQGSGVPGDWGTLVDYSGGITRVEFNESGLWIVQLTNLKQAFHYFRVVVDEGQVSNLYVVRVTG